MGQPRLLGLGLGVDEAGDLQQQVLPLFCSLPSLLGDNILDLGRNGSTRFYGRLASVLQLSPEGIRFNLLDADVLQEFLENRLEVLSQ